MGISRDDLQPSLVREISYGRVWWMNLNFILLIGIHVLSPLGGRIGDLAFDDLQPSLVREMTMGFWSRDKSFLGGRLLPVWALTWVAGAQLL